jgi:hypothetical protein
MKNIYPDPYRDELIMRLLYTLNMLIASFIKLASCRSVSLIYLNVIIIITATN